MIVRALAVMATVALTAASARRGTEKTEIGRWPNGTIAYERHYVDGQEHGTEVGRWDDGSLRFVFHYEHGLMEGRGLEWLPGGRQLYRETNSRAGHEEGLQRMWWPDGTLRASYVVRDGRRFGLLGAKGCTGDSTAADSARRSQEEEQ